ncbi:MAG: molybdopterin-binding protein [Sediminibacterium sp.]|nr:molybdopterin-binding protein [Sediminibacterium sp.]
MKKYSLFLVMLLQFFLVNAQKEARPTDIVEISGAIRQNVTFGYEDLLKFPVVPIKNLVIYNHQGEEKGTHKRMKGVLLKHVLANLVFDADNAKLLSEYYLTMQASDGYQVVFSWNELFNSPTGDQVYLVTEKDGKQLKQIPECILLICTSDFKTGRRNVKWLKKIIVGRV